MFWWLYGMSDTSKRDSAPLVVWLQGGPGASSTGFGNFLEIGPEDVNQQPRAINWVQSANVLFIDNPVGTGYSYVTNENAYVKTDKQIGVDLVTLMKAVVQKFPQFQTNPFWIFCESYGGKMATSFGVALSQAIANGEIKMNFKGVALGDSWISPIDFVMTWADYLLATSEIDSNGYTQIQAAANVTLADVLSKHWVQATNDWGNVEGVIEAVSNNVNFYNILDRVDADMTSMKRGNSSFDNIVHRSLRRYMRALDPEDELDALMNGPIKKKLGIPASVKWGGQANNVFENLQAAFMQDIISGVDYLISKGYSVNVYSGNLDLICCTPGTLAWVNKLKWSGLSQWQTSKRIPFAVPGSGGVTVGFTKTFKNFNFVNILAAGHMVPADQPAAAIALLDAIID
jgi:serine carboxypeptidase 1